jgi:DNA (cytosine-5)-methyltransferase 1
MTELRIGSLFSGIGGLELGLEWAGVGQTVWQVESNAFCRAILRKHWPRVPRFLDVRNVGKHNLDPVDVLCGGFPCQDLSTAGKKEGIYGKRSGLWFEYLRIVSEIKPAIVVVENVSGLIRRGLDEVVAGLSDEGYAVEATRIRASDLGAKHQRERLFLVAANANGIALLAIKQRGTQASWNGKNRGLAGWPSLPTWEAQPRICRVVDGATRWPHRANRLKALGNAVVPQCASVVGKRILEHLES